MGREPEWDEQSRTWALALAMREAGECRRCGGDLAETLDYDFKWVPEPPAVCLRCAALQDDEKKQAKHPQHAAMIHRVRKVPRPKPKPRRRR